MSRSAKGRKTSGDLQTRKKKMTYRGSAMQTMILIQMTMLIQCMLITRIEKLFTSFKAKSQVTERKESTKIIQQVHKEFKDDFTGIQCFDGTFSL